MNKCALCGRKISNREYNFGLGCLKKMCNSVGLYNVKNMQGEDLLNKRVSKLCNKRALSKKQKQLLTDRYLTLNLLNEVPIASYDRYKKLLQKDIDNINRTRTNMSSSNIITLKQASEINKIYKKNENIFQKIMNGEYDTIQKISFSVVNLAFSLYYNKKPYLSDELQWLQHYVLKGGIMFLSMKGYKYSAEFLDHSLQENPSDLFINNNGIVDIIKINNDFKKTINNIILKYGDQTHFDTGKNNESLSFESGDLFAVLHNAYIQVIGNKQPNNNWNLQITLSDVYDFTEFKTLREYFEDDETFKLLATIGNNIAILGTSCNIVNPYNVTITFNLENWEAIDVE